MPLTRKGVAQEMPNSESTRSTTMMASRFTLAKQPNSLECVSDGI